MHEIEQSARTVERRRRWGRDAAFASITLGAFGAFLAISRTLERPRATKLDRMVMRGLGSLRSPALNAAVGALTELGGLPGITSLALGAVFFKRHKRRDALQVALGALGGVVAELGLKQIFGRERPRELAHLERVTSKSFPSGHAVASASFYLTLAFVAARGPRAKWRAPLLLAGSSIAGLVGLTRVYLGVHYPTDVVGGFALGTAWASLLEAVFDYDRVQEITAHEPLAALP